MSALAPPRSFRLLGAGATRRLVDDAGPTIADRLGIELIADFAPVGVVLERLRAGEPADLVALSRETIGEVGGTPYPLGTTATVFIRRADDDAEPLDSLAKLRAALLASPLLLMPDLNRSTGGRHVAAIFARLGIADAIAPRIRPVDGGGLGGAKALLAQDAPGALSCAQAVEIAHLPGIASAGMPAEYALRTTYCLAALTAAVEPVAAALAESAHRGIGGLEPIGSPT